MSKSATELQITILCTSITLKKPSTFIYLLLLPLWCIPLYTDCVYIYIYISVYMPVSSWEHELCYKVGGVMLQVGFITLWTCLWMKIGLIAMSSKTVSLEPETIVISLVTQINITVFRFSLMGKNLVQLLDLKPSNVGKIDIQQWPRYKNVNSI